MTDAWLQEALATVASSTTSHGQRLAEWAQAKADAEDGRGRSGRQRAQEVHEEMRDRIIAAAGAFLPTLDPTRRGWVNAVYKRITKSPAKYHFAAAPDKRTIEKAREYLLQKSSMTLASCIPQGPIAPQTSASST